MRLVDGSRAIREAYPESYLDLAILVTEFGGVTGLLVVLAVLYWTGARRETAFVVSVATAGLLATIALKHLLAMPRPPAAVAAIELEQSDPYGVPSGHAFASTVVYGGLAVVHDLHRRWWGIAGVALAVTAISLSRIVIGVHYLGDVLVGIAFGVAFLAAMLRVTDGDPRRGFAIGAVLGLPALVVTGVAEYTLIGFGGALGGVLAAGRIDDSPPGSWLERAGLVVVGVGFVLALRGVEDVVATIRPALVALNAVLFAGILLLPAGVGRLLERVPSRRASLRE